MYARYIPPEDTEARHPTDPHDDRVAPQKRKRNPSSGDQGLFAGRGNSPKKLRKGRINVVEPLLSLNGKGESEGGDRDEGKQRGLENSDRRKTDSEDTHAEEHYLGSDKQAAHDLENDQNDPSPAPTVHAPINPERQRRIEDEERHSSIFSKFDKSSSLAQSLAKTSLDDEGTSKDKIPVEESTELFGLTPLPQPEPAAQPPKAPAFSALPSWLANPVVVPATEKMSFECLNISPKLKALLKARGYSEAFAIQSALVSLLLAGSDQQVGDICISAATGSGKTLSYVLPIIEKLRDRVVTKLRALIVVPTRELVSQVRDACELCLSGSGLQVGIAVGHRQFNSEQDSLVKRVHRYDPQAFEATLNQPTKLLNDNVYDAAIDDHAAEDVTSVQPDHVVEYSSKIDILISTPGRLVDHIRNTPGFTLDDLQWLVIDEADRLLSQSFQEWITITMGILERERPMSDLRMDQRILQMMDHRPISTDVRKIVLSATMTRDVGKLSVLKLRNPKLVVVDHGNLESPGEDTDRADFLDPSRADESFDLPDSLHESAISVGDESEKPLYLVQLLRMHILERGTTTRDQKERAEASSDSAEESSGNDCVRSSDEGSDDSASLSGSEPVLATLSPGRSSMSGGDHDENTRYQAANIGHVDRSKLISDSETSGVLIFTKSNESAIRLARLIAILHPSYQDRLGTLTSTQSSSQRRRRLRLFLSGTTSLLIASDLVSRGMDIPNLAHVINYDLPTSIRAYVHRVGRTARAGKGGQAWTLVTDKEARWFWRSVGRGPEIRRAKGHKIQRVTIDMAALSEEVRGGYRKALETLGDEVRGDQLHVGALQKPIR